MRFTPFALFALAGCVSAARPGAGWIRPDALGSANDVEVCRAAAASLGEADAAGAIARLDQVIGAPGFEGASEAERHCVLYLRGVAALSLKDWPGALEFFRGSSATSLATAYDWQARLYAARYVAGHAEPNPEGIADAVASLTALARRWPDTLSWIAPATVLRVAKGAAKLPETQARFDMLDALFDARWKQGVLEPSVLWKDLALLSLERSDFPRARKAARRVTAPNVLIAMRADRRFDAIVQADPARFDVLKAQAAELEQMRAAVRESPRSLHILLDLVKALDLARKHEETLQLTQTVLSRVEKERIRAPYDDVKETLNRVLDWRANALFFTGRWIEAVETLSRAARIPEGKLGKNVDQALDLGILLCRLDRPKEALSAVAHVERNDLSAHGRLVLETVRLLAAVELDDAGAAETALANLRREDDPESVEFAFIALGRLEDAARILVARLEDPRLRSDALYGVQDIVLPPAVPSRQLQWRARDDAMIARPEVQAAILKYGRIEHYDLGPGAATSPSR